MDLVGKYGHDSWMGDLINNFHFRDVTIMRDYCLGQGGYGIVYKAKCDQLVCAAKYLYPIYFVSGDPGVVDAVARFRRECQLLSHLKHPNIVQYLGTHEEVGVNTVILLMEAMDQSLHAYLENHRGHSLPFHIEVNFMHDVALALDYLHTNRIHHRDLSCKNILLLGEVRAKVSDFGMSKLREPNSGYSSKTPCPGAISYMPPEVLKVPPDFKETLDEFSFGVVMIQIMNRRDPQPTDLHQEHNGVLTIVPEKERRRLDIELCNQLNPLLQLALSCISNEPKDRPLATRLCQMLSLLQTTTEYRDSIENVQTGTKLVPIDYVSVDINDRGQHLLDRIDSLKSQLHEKDKIIRDHTQLIALRDQQLREKHRPVVPEQRVNVTEIQARVVGLEGKLMEKERDVQKLTQSISLKDQKIMDLQRALEKEQKAVKRTSKQQEQADEQVSSYISQIELLKYQLEESRKEIGETRSRLLAREHELAKASMNQLRMLRK